MARSIESLTTVVVLALSQFSELATANRFTQNSTANSHLPIVDLGYELQQASEFNHTGGYYNFSNVRYAAPPVGKLRFAAPHPPTTNRSVVQTGSEGRICPQAIPAWTETAFKFIPDYLANPDDFNASSITSSNSTSNVPKPDPKETEDCLFLDVMVPKKVFRSSSEGYGAPVLVWIHGGGYTIGSKTGSGNPAGLIARSQNEGSNEGSDGMIYVALNYRLGAFGWLSGPTFQENGTANAGLYDQRMALQWIKHNIAKFGGDPDRVTVMGESAGGGSIMHQITAYGGMKGPAPFAQAITQSPGWFPMVSNSQQESISNAFLHRLNISTIEEARKLPSSKLQRVSFQQVATSQYGTFTFGPVVDGDFVPSLPGELLLHGRFDKDVRLMVGHNADEGLLFTSLQLQNASSIESAITGILPSLKANPKAKEYVFDILYPNVLDGTRPMNYTNSIARAAAIISDIVITCNPFFLDKAYENKIYSYLFAVYPAIHGEDVSYTFFNGPSKDVTTPDVAIALQTYITNFVKQGNPNSDSVPYFGMYGSNSTIQVLNTTGISAETEEAAPRCDWWQKALYY